MTLDSIAAQVNVSPYYLTRAFTHLYGQSIMRYVRGRRLSMAARELANGAPDVLAVALAAGYGSHEAFTRAFREQFGQTPEAVRAQGHIDNLAIVEPVVMTHQQLPNLEPPRFEQGKPMLIAGISARYHCEQRGGIPSQWQRFLSYFGHIPDQLNQVAYGIIYNTDDAGNMEYMCGTQVRDEVADAPMLEVYGPEFDSHSGHGGFEIWLPLKS